MAHAVDTLSREDHFSSLVRIPIAILQMRNYKVPECATILQINKEKEMEILTHLPQDRKTTALRIGNIY
jgi:hypothetical protein